MTLEKERCKCARCSASSSSSSLIWICPPPHVFRVLFLSPTLLLLPSSSSYSSLIFLHLHLCFYLPCLIIILLNHFYYPPFFFIHSTTPPSLSSSTSSSDVWGSHGCMWFYPTKTLFCISGRQPRSPAVVAAASGGVIGGVCDTECVPPFREPRRGRPQGGRAAELNSKSSCWEHPCG